MICWMEIRVHNFVEICILYLIYKIIGHLGGVLRDFPCCHSVLKFTQWCACMMLYVWLLLNMKSRNMLYPSIDIYNQQGKVFDIVSFMQQLYFVVNTKLQMQDLSTIKNWCGTSVFSIHFASDVLLPLHRWTNEWYVYEITTA